MVVSQCSANAVEPKSDGSPWSHNLAYRHGGQRPHCLQNGTVEMGGILLTIQFLNMLTDLLVCC